MNIWQLLYRMKKITAEQIWERVDSGAISAEEAVKICGRARKRCDTRRESACRGA